MNHKFISLYVLLILSGSMLSQINDTLNPDVKSVNNLLVEHKYFLALKTINININNSIKSNDLEHYVWFLCEKGTVYLDTISSDSAKIYYEQALFTAKEINYKKGICYSLMGIGKYHYRNSNYPLAIQYFQLLNYNASNYNDTYYKLRANYYLSASYQLLKSYQTSINYSKIATKISVQSRDTSSYISSLLSIGADFDELQDFDSAFYYYTLANNVYNRWYAKNLTVGSAINNSLLKIQIKNKDFKKGIVYGKLAIKFAVEENNYVNLDIYYDNVAVCFRELKMYDSASYYFEKALNIELDFNYIDGYKLDLKELISIYKTTGNTDKAFYYMDRYLNADSLYQTTGEDIINNLKADFALEKSKITLKAEEDNLKDSYKKKQIIYSSIGVILILLIVALTYVLYIRKIHAKEKEKQNLVIRAKDAESIALQSQMNPHFIFNALGTITGYIAENNRDKAINYLGIFSKLIRYNLEKSRERLVTVNDEAQMLRSYLILEQERYSNKFNFNIIVDESIDDSIALPPMFIQPFVENAILHGVIPKSAVGLIEITFYVSNKNCLICLVEDDGIGKTESMKRKSKYSSSHNSLALAITEERMEVLNLMNDERIHISTLELIDDTNAAKGMLITFNFPLDYI